MPRLLLLLPATTYRANAFLEAARRLGLEVTVASSRPDALPARMLGEQPGNEVLSLDLDDPEGSARAVVEFAQQRPIHAVVGVDDQTTVVAAIIAATLGLPHNSVASVAAARNKHRMRDLLHEHGLPVPRYAVFSIDDDPATLTRRVSFPCVVKPLMLSASCGVVRADDAAGLVTAFRRVAALLTRLGMAATCESDDPGCQLLVEDFVPGAEVALEGLLTNGELRVLALFDKPDPMNGPFFEETSYVTPSRLPGNIQAELASSTARAATALGLREGPVHAELRVNEKGVWVIMELPTLDRARQPAGVMMLPIPRAGVLSEVHGQEEALAVPGIEELEMTVQPGEVLVPLPEGTRYLGFLIARGPTPEAVEAALREAHQRLEFVIREELSLSAKEARARVPGF